MRANKLRHETVYLREFAAHCLNELAFDDAAEEQMRRGSITLVEVNHAMKTGFVVNSEKEDAEGAIWVVEGKNCDDDKLVITLEVFCDRNHMCIKRVIKVMRK